MPQLWNYFGGEPFMVNPQVGIINPKRKRGKKMAKRRMPAGLARYWAKHRRGKKRSSPRRKRRNPYPVAGMVVNPRKRKRSRARTYSRKRRHHARRNPAIMGFTIPPLGQVIFAGVGFIAPPMVEGFLSRFIPADWQGNTIGKYAIRIASVIGLTFAVKRFVGPTEGRMVAIGGSVYILSTAIQEFAPGLIPGMGMYVPPGVGAYVPGTGRTFNTMGAPSIAMFPVSNGSGGGASGSSGAIGGTASRFKRI